MDSYVGKIVAVLKSGAKVVYQAEVTAGGPFDAAQMCKLRARLDLIALAPEFSAYVDVKAQGAVEYTAYRVE
jgi:hypothetical protein